MISGTKDDDRAGGEWPQVRTDADRIRTLTDALEEARQEAADLRAQIEQAEEARAAEEYEDEWRWRHIRTLEGEQAMPELPVPRLEIRWRAVGSGTTRIADYGLVYRHYSDDQLRFVPLESTRCSGGRVLDSDPGAALGTPWRMGAHLMADMLSLNLPGFVVSEFGMSRQIDVATDPDTPTEIRRRLTPEGESQGEESGT